MRHPQVTWAYVALIAMALSAPMFSAPFQMGDIFITERDGLVHRFDSSGTLLQSIPVGIAAWGLEFDATGSLCHICRSWSRRCS